MLASPGKRRWNQPAMVIGDVFCRSKLIGTQFYILYFMRQINSRIRYCSIVRVIAGSSSSSNKFK